MSAHPRTDKVSTPHIGFYSCATVPSSFAAELETEIESLKKEIEPLKTKIVNQCDRIRYLEGATSHACGTPLSIAIKERDRALNRMADALQEVDLRTLDFERMKQERDEAREVLMEIAEANNFDNIGNWARNKARKALGEQNETYT
jgi:hypothetical protein